MDVVYNFFYLMFSAIFIGSVWWGTLRLMDRAAGIRFRAKLRIIETDPMALAIYLGVRLLALAILFAPLLRVVL